MTKAALSRLVFALCSASFLVGAAPARATTVAILAPPTPSPDVTQVLTILRGELLSLGIEITMSDPMAESDAASPSSVMWLEPLAAQGANAVIRAIGDGALEAIDVWIVKPSLPRFEVTHVAADPDAARQPETLAFRAVEALRAGLLQIDWAARKKREEPIANPPAPIVSGPSAGALEGHVERVGLELGAAAVSSLDGVGLALLPTLSLGWLASPSLSIHGSLAGWGSKSMVTSTTATAEVAQQYAIMGGRYRLRATRRLWPFLGLGGGVLRTQVAGQSSRSTTGQHLDQWSALVDLSAGAGLGVHGRLYLTLAAHVQLADPYVAIHIVDRTAATSGRPNLLLTLTVGAWL